MTIDWSSMWANVAIVMAYFDDLVGLLAVLAVAGGVLLLLRKFLAH